MTGSDGELAGSSIVDGRAFEGELLSISNLHGCDAVDCKAIVGLAWIVGARWAQWRGVWVAVWNGHLHGDVSVDARNTSNEGNSKFSEVHVD